MDPSEQENQNASDSTDKGVGFVIIPFDYDQLSDDQKKSIVPICIASRDRHGNPIARIWFEQGVAPVQDHLRTMARLNLGDIHRVSELAERTVHKLWERHGEDVWRHAVEPGDDTCSVGGAPHESGRVPVAHEAHGSSGAGIAGRRP